ncbi:MAG: NAD(P)/FAD-dependent oxidoreductase [Bacteroidia bacterium]|nr:NAD(P)/FAD-dependent oxidoreductase [Bacteroidia bacterium]
MSEKRPHVIVIGGGFGGLQLIKKLGNKPVDITWFDKNNYHTFQPLLYQVASGGLGPDSIAYPLRKLAAKLPNVKFRMAQVLEIKPAQNQIITAIGNFTFDYLVIATGSVTNFYGNKSLENNCMQLKTIGHALDLRSDILQEFEKAIVQQNTETIHQILNFVIVGGGPTGVETAGAIAEIKNNVLPADYRELNPDMMQVHLIESGNVLLSMFDSKLSEKANADLTKLGVKVWLNTRVISYENGLLQLSNGTNFKTDTVIWSAGVAGQTIKGLETAVVKGNRYQVNEFNNIAGFDNIFAIGDVAAMYDTATPNGHPQVAPVAIQQAALLAQNILMHINAKPLKPFAYKDRGSMATIGRHKAIVQSMGFKWSGYTAWFVWMFLHLMLLVSYRNRLMVLVNWMWNYFTYQRAIRIIVRPFVNQQLKN